MVERFPFGDEALGVFFEIIHAWVAGADVRLLFGLKEISFSEHGFLVQGICWHSCEKPRDFFPPFKIQHELPTNQTRSRSAGLSA